MKKKILTSLVILLTAAAIAGCTESPPAESSLPPETAAVTQAQTLCPETEPKETAVPETTGETTCSHSYRSQITKAPTCTQAGEKVYTCSLCGFTLRERIPPLDHSFVITTRAPDCTSPGCTVYRCKDCGYTREDSFRTALGHSFGPWITVVAPTEGETGLARCTCTRCGEEATMVLPRIGTLS